jgi:tetratricopeptide (TPR) repeat protein/predicted Ser/Thr protein kinase
MMQCPFCKRENSPTAAKCKYCGKPLPGPEETFLGEARVQRPEQSPIQAEAVETFVPNKTSGTPEDWTAPVTGGKVPLASQGEFEPGTVLGGRYEILVLLGQGGMGSVYKARDRELDRLVALKIIRPELTTNPEILRRFKQELILARQVTHRNVIRIFDLGQADGFKFITMEYLDGKDLRAVLKEKGKLTPEEAARIIAQICRALEVAHGEGVVHRDLKPQNIMLDANGRAYVMDFGIARSAYLPGMTQTGALIGTPEYMSPEQAKGEKLDERSDLFSLGVIFYELITGQSPFYSDTPLATLWKRMQEKAKPVCEVDPTVPKALSDIVAKAMEIEPTDRFASAGEMAQELEFWLNPSTGRTTIIVPSARTAPYWKWASAALVVLLVAAVVAYRLKAPAKPEAAHAPVSVLVADFTNHTGDPIFDGTLEPMFNVALEGASFVNAFSRGDARKLAEQLPHPTDKLDEQPARLVAVSQGINAVVTGEISLRGDKYSLSATALDAVSGKVIAKTEVTAANKDDVLLKIPQLAAPIRKELGDTTSQSAQMEAAGGAFTAASLEAVHQYGIAMEEQAAGKFEEALRSFSKAAELDPNFARAYSGIASTYGDLGRPSDAEKYAKLAMEHIDRMTERERYRVRGLYYSRAENWQRCVEEYSELVKKYPGDNIGHNNLANCYSQLRNWPKAIEEIRADVAIHPEAAGLANLALFSSYGSDFQSGEREARRLQQLMPNFEYGYLALAFAQVGQGQLPQATESYNKLGSISPLGASMSTAGLADLDLYEGRFTEAVRLLEKGAGADLAAKASDSAADKYASLAYTQTMRGDKKEAVAAAEKALAIVQSVKIRFVAARTFVEAGELPKAQKLADSLSSDIRPGPQVYGKIIEGLIALKNKDRVKAIKDLNDANKLLDTWIGRFDLGRAYIEAEAFTEATSELDQCIARRGESLALFLDEAPTAGYFPAVHYFMGRAKEGLKSPGAADSYRTYLSLRGNAGEDPLLREIHRRLGQ